MTESWRVLGQKQLLLGTIKPHKEVVTSTVSGWIKATLTAVGIDTKLFTAHSTRSASTSKAKVNGLSTAEVLKRGNWSNKSTWQRHYHKQVITETQKFQEHIGLSDALN